MVGWSSSNLCSVDYATPLWLRSLYFCFAYFNTMKENSLTRFKKVYVDNSLYAYLEGTSPLSRPCTGETDGTLTAAASRPPPPRPLSHYCRCARLVKARETVCGAAGVVVLIPDHKF
jgi:hypothetical protein